MPQTPLIRIERRAFFLSDVRVWLEPHVEHHSNDGKSHGLGHFNAVTPIISSPANITSFRADILAPAR
jgi:hypothetical protein